MYIVKLKFNNATKLLLTEVCESRDASSIESLFMQLADAELASLKLTKFLNRKMVESKPMQSFPKYLSNREAKSRASAETAQKILLLRGQLLAPERIAERLGISVMRVHRVIQNFEACKTRVQIPTLPRNGKYKGASMDLLLPPKAERNA